MLCFAIPNSSKPSPSNPSISAARKALEQQKQQQNQQQKREWDYIPKENRLSAYYRRATIPRTGISPIKNIVKFQAYNYYLSAAETIRQVFAQ